MLTNSEREMNEQQNIYITKRVGKPKEQRVGVIKQTSEGIGEKLKYNAQNKKWQKILLTHLQTQLFAPFQQWDHSFIKGNVITYSKHGNHREQSHI